jgi:hypothetical protein
MHTNTTFPFHLSRSSRVLFRSRSRLNSKLKLAIGCRA